MFYYQKVIKSSIHKAKKNYYSTQFKENISNFTKMSSLIREIQTNSQNCSSKSQSIKHKQLYLYDKIDIANEFNIFFNTIADKITVSLPDPVLVES